MSESSLRVRISADLRGFQDGIGRAMRQLDQFGSKASKIGQDLSLRISLPLAIAGGSAIKMASDVQESFNKVNVAFGSSAKEVRDFADTSLKSFGIARANALDMAALFGDMATGMGVSQHSAAQLSREMVALAGDLSSFKNINIEEVTTALAGVFTGETESLKRLGIVMTEVNLEQFRMEQGMKKTLKQMTQQEKIMLRLQYVMSVTKNAQGDFARTSGSMANQLRIAQGQLKQLAEDLGNIMLPIALKAVNKINDLAEEFKKLDDNTKALIVTLGALGASLPPAIYVFGKLLNRTSLIIGAVAALGYAAYKNFDQFVDGVLEAANSMRKLYNDFRFVQVMTDILVVGFDVLRLTLAAAFQYPSEFIKRLALQIAAIYNQTLAYFNVLNKFLFDVKGMGAAFDEAAAAIDKTMEAFTQGSIFNMDVFQSDLREMETRLAKLGAKISGGELDVLPMLSKDQIVKPFEDAATYIKNLMSSFATEVSEDMDMTNTEAFRNDFGLKSVGEKFKVGYSNLLMIVANSSDNMEARMDELRNRLNSIMADGFTGMIESLAESIGKGSSVIDILKSFLGSIATMMVQMGKLMIAYGSSMVAFKKAFANPKAAVAAGIALVVIGSAIRGMANKDNDVPAFANGGIISGPTLGLMGEYAGAKNNPEVVAPLDRLKNMIGDGAGSNVNVSGEFRVQGQDLVVALERANKQRGNFL